MKVAVGDAIPGVEVTADPERMKTMALILRDPNPIHWDVAAVTRLGLGDRPVNQGPNNMAYVVNMLVGWAGDVGALRSVRVRFLAPAFAGDRLRTGGTVTGVRVEDGARAVDCEVWLDSGEVRVIAGDATLVFPPDEAA